MRFQKLPGKTLAESAGIVVPDDAPGGHPIESWPGMAAGRPQNVLNADYDGFYDVDAFDGDGGDR